LTGLNSVSLNNLNLYLLNLKGRKPTPKGLVTTSNPKLCLENLKSSNPLPKTPRTSEEGYLFWIVIQFTMMMEASLGVINQPMALLRKKPLVTIVSPGEGKLD
jgi:hypothetical protein